MEGRRERKKRQTREVIAETALRLFAEHGFDNVTIADVAAEADVAVNTVFNHFKTKEELFFGSFNPQGDTLAERLHTRAPGVSPARCILEGLQEHFDRLMAPDPLPEHYLRFARFRQVLDGSEALQARAANLMRARRWEALSVVAAALAEPAEPDSLSFVVAGQLLALQDGIFFEFERLRRAGRTRQEIAEVVVPTAERAVAMLMAGLKDYGVRDSSPTA